MDRNKIFSDGYDVALTFAPNASGDSDRIVIERGAHRDSDEYYGQVGEVIASKSGLPFPEAVASLDGSPAKVRLPLPVFGNGSTYRTDAARTTLALAAKALLRAAVTDGVSVAVATVDGPRGFTAEPVPATASPETQSEIVGPDTASLADNQANTLREEF